MTKQKQIIWTQYLLPFRNYLKNSNYQFLGLDKGGWIALFSCQRPVMWRYTRISRTLCASNPISIFFFAIKIFISFQFSNLTSRRAFGLFYTTVILFFLSLLSIRVLIDGRSLYKSTWNVEIHNVGPEFVWCFDAVNEQWRCLVFNLIKQRRWNLTNVARNLTITNR